MKRTTATVTCDGCGYTFAIEFATKKTLSEVLRVLSAAHHWHIDRAGNQEFCPKCKETLHADE